MIEIDIPGWRILRIQHLLLDLNGTLALDGELLPIQAQVRELATRLDVHLLSADTHGTLEAVAAELGVAWTRLSAVGAEAGQKAHFAQRLGADRVAALGNGANDVGMLEVAALAIAVVGPEGAFGPAVTVADLVVGAPEVGLELLLKPARLVATLRR